MAHTQIEVLEKIEKLYSQVLNITALVNLDGELGGEKPLQQRGKLIDEIEKLQLDLDSLEKGASDDEIAELKKGISSLLLAVLSDSEPLIEKSQEYHASLKKELAGAQSSMQAAKAYAAQG